ncbi:MAG: tetratricopeptide repeat protein [Candidatus Aminicenantes bacterium]|nr:tetratricopeptide repeat protein [Candidatus Aminicenantes bacterium]
MVFKDKKAGNYINSRFVSLRFNALKADGNELRKKYQVAVFPTVLFLNSAGDEIDRICGFDGDKDTYVKIITDYAAGKNTLKSILAEVKAKSGSVDVNYKLAKKYTSRYQRDKAAPYFQKVLKLDPEDKKGHKTEALCYTALHEARANKSITPLLSFIAANTDKEFFYMSYNGLASYYAKTKKAEKAIAVFEEGLKKMPEHVGWLVNYARYIVGEKIESKYDRAAELAKKAVTLTPEKYKQPAYMQLGYLFQDMKKFKKAEETFLNILKTWPDYTGAIYQLGRNAVFSGKNLEKGLSYFKQYLEHKPKAGDPEWADAYWRMGMIYEKLGDKKKAAAQYKEALKLNPNHPNSKDSLKKLDS